jgi:hypothetical protein
MKYEPKVLLNNSKDKVKLFNQAFFPLEDFHALTYKKISGTVSASFNGSVTVQVTNDSNESETFSASVNDTLTKSFSGLGPCPSCERPSPFSKVESGTVNVSVDERKLKEDGTVGTETVIRPAFSSIQVVASPALRPALRSTQENGAIEVTVAGLMTFVGGGFDIRAINVFNGSYCTSDFPLSITKKSTSSQDGVRQDSVSGMEVVYRQTGSIRTTLTINLNIE